MTEKNIVITKRTRFEILNSSILNRVLVVKMQLLKHPVLLDVAVLVFQYSHLFIMKR
jgi:hypothetical protein